MLAHSGLPLSDPVGHPGITQTIHSRMCDAVLTEGKHQLNKTVLVRGVLCLLPFLLGEGGMCVCRKPPKLAFAGLKLMFARASSYIPVVLHANMKINYVRGSAPLDQKSNRCDKTELNMSFNI